MTRRRTLERSEICHLSLQQGHELSEKLPSARHLVPIRTVQPTFFRDGLDSICRETVQGAHDRPDAFVEYEVGLLGDGRTKRLLDIGGVQNFIDGRWRPKRQEANSGSRSERLTSSLRYASLNYGFLKSRP